MMSSLYFYDLETSGFSPREQRIMQFAGQRTDLDLKPIGEPHNFLIKMSEDTLPDPDAVLLTGITPQMTIAEGLSEAEFLKIFRNEISTQGTIFTGYNSIRFDDEFMRFLHYRNFYDAYEWHWADNRSRWDLLDVVRMTRALRPEGIKWPFNSDGQPANQLGLLTSLNRLEHSSAHDALSDVQATIALAGLLRSKQPKLFDFLLQNRDKKSVSKIVNSGMPFVYTSGKFASENEKTTIVSTLFENDKKSGVLVYDLRHDPAPYIKMKAIELAEIWQHYCKERPCPHPRLPVKTLQYNRCPAVAPLSVFNKECEKRLNLNINTATKNLKILENKTDFQFELKLALELMDKKHQSKLLSDQIDVDERLYESFFEDKDRELMRTISSAEQSKLLTTNPNFADDRLNLLLPLYKARNYPKSLTDQERIAWELFRDRKLLSGKQSSRAAKYFERLAQLAVQKDLNVEKKYLLEELHIYGQSILPVTE